MLRSTLTIILVGALLSACSSSSSPSSGGGDSEPLAPQARFLTPDKDGRINGNLVNGPETQNFVRDDGTGTGYATALGPTTSDGLGGFAGILPDSQVVAPQTTGTITYEVIYDVKAFLDIQFEDGVYTYDSGIGDRDQIELVADFDAYTLTGSSSDNEFTVNGTLSDTSDAISGSITWLDVDAELTGLAGSDKVVGAFQGSNSNSIIVGGFLGDAQPAP